MKPGGGGKEKGARPVPPPAKREVRHARSNAGRLLEVATCRSQSFSSTAQRLLARNGSSCSSSFSALSEVHLVNRRAELADRHSSQVFLADDALLGAMHDQRDRDRQDLHRFLSAAPR